MADLTRPLWDYLIQTVLAIETHTPTVTHRANPDIPSAHINLLQYGGLEMAWIPETGWRVYGTHRATGAPAGKARYLHAGPVPPPAVVADRVGAWQDGDLVLSDMQPYYPAVRDGLAEALRAAARPGAAVEYECGRCGDWGPAPDGDDGDLYCGECGVPVVLRECAARPAQDGGRSDG